MKMNRKLFTVAIVLVTLAIIAAPVAAVLPAQSPLPRTGVFNTIWGLLQDLQSHITALTTSVTNIPSMPVVVTCNTTTGENIEIGGSIRTCALLCPDGTRALDATFDNSMINPSVRGTLGLGHVIPNDGLEHSGKILCL